MRERPSSKREFVRVAACVPTVAPCDVKRNVASIASCLREAREKGAEVVVFPELCVTGYTCADLFYQETLLSSAAAGLEELIPLTTGALVAVGLPLRVGSSLYNVAAVLFDGRLVGVVPKTFLPSSHEFYEARWFASARDAHEKTVTLAGVTVPFGNDLVFSLGDGACVGVELCEDLWSPTPPSTHLMLAGANIVLNLSASNELVGKASYRKDLVVGQSARGLASYVYASAGVGESTTDLVFSGATLIAENGVCLAEGERFVRGESVTIADVDVGFLSFERAGATSFREAASLDATAIRVQDCPLPPLSDDVVPGDLMRRVDPHPFVPPSGPSCEARCAEVFALQATGLATRLTALSSASVVIGLSGGLDSALALLVCVEAFERLNLPKSGIHVFTLPGFGTSSRTRANAESLCRALGLSLETSDISPVVTQHLKDLRHDIAVTDVVYENAQARARTYFLMDKANQVGGLVVGTGDLSELALGWCTFNADHMSMYGVNSGVPKTLVRHLVAWYASRHAEAAAPLGDILSTPVSPELLPLQADGSIAQKTEDHVGPYELHDFFLYHFVRRGASREKIRLLAEKAFAGVFDAATVARWLDVFFRRFFTQQFKRNCLPDGPKVGTINLSPRGDWRMPSDARPIF